jgi:tripartite motif-containing protein 71
VFFEYKNMKKIDKKLTYYAIIFLVSINFYFAEKSYAYDTNDLTAMPDYLGQIFYIPQIPDKYVFFSYVYGVASDSEGNVYIGSNITLSNIQKFDSDGNFITKWGSSGTGDGQFNGISDVAVDNDDNIYVCEGDRIQKFDSNGNFIRKWGSWGSADGQFSSIRGCGIDSNNNVYVADAGTNDRIQKFSSDGLFLEKWGSTGTGDGQFDEPMDVAVDTSGNFFVSEDNNKRIQKFDLNGAFITKWGSTGTGDGQFNYPSFLKIDNGTLYVSDVYNDRIQTFDLNGNFLSKWGEFGYNNGEFEMPFGLTVGTNGKIYIYDYGNNRIEVFNSDRSFYAKWYNSALGSGNGQFDNPIAVLVDLSDNVYVYDEDNDRIQKFDSDGNFIAKWGEYGDEGGQFYSPCGSCTRGMDYDSQGNIYITDPGNYRIQKFDSNGNFLSSFGSYGSGDNQFNSYFFGLAVDSEDNVFVAYTYRHKIKKFDAEGNFLTEWGSSGSADGQFEFPENLVIDSNDNIYVVDENNNRVQKFDQDGNFITKWGSYGTGDGQFNYPESIGIDRDDNIFVVDTYSNRIQKFDSDGNFLYKFGTYNAGNDENFGFSRPYGVAISQRGRIYVADSGNNRIQIFGDSTSPDNNSSDIEYWIKGREKEEKGNNLNKFQANFINGKDLRLQGQNIEAKSGYLKIYERTKKGGKHLIETEEIDFSGDWDAKLDDFKNGKSKTIYFKTIDLEGNESEMSPGYDIILDSKKPYFKKSQIDLFQTYKKKPQIINFEADDGETEVSFYRLKLIQNNKVIKNWRKQKSNYYYVPSDVKPGTYTLVIRAYDKAGNKVEKMVTVLVR